MTKSIRKASYDSNNDVLYLHFSDTSSANSYGAEENDDFVVMRDIDTNEITGITVFYPQKNTGIVEKHLQESGYSFSIRQYT